MLCKLLHVFLIFLSLVLLSVVWADEGPSAAIIIRNQANEYHQKLANAKKTSLEAQIISSKVNAKVVLLHDVWPVEAAWTILPIIPSLMKKYSEEYDWVMFVEDTTVVDVPTLFNSVLPKYDPGADLALCRCLYDNEPTIIHHYAFFDGNVKNFKYPDFDAGWLLSRALVQKIGLDWDPDKMKSDFQIDIKHEIAMFLDKTHNVKMSCIEQLCGGNDKKRDCATSVGPSLPDCGDRYSLNDILVSVKTTQMFHKDRVTVVQKTWGKYVPNIVYYSNISDPSIPTVDSGVPNTLRGHCGKMEAIINQAHSLPDLKHFSWLVISDDDSIIGVSKLVRLLNCYDHKHILVLGERYGFGLLSGHGYGYITGGGGMIMSRAAVEAWHKNGCKCPSIDTPDDMYLGQCFSFNVGVPVTHTPLLHQARPVDYSDGYLSNQEPVSFHKHWEIDPYMVYAKWFEPGDKAEYEAPPPVTPTQAPEPQVVPIPPTPTENYVKDEL